MNKEINLSKLFKSVVFLGTICIYPLSSSYSMDMALQDSNHKVPKNLNMKVQIKGNRNTISITSLSSLERKMKERTQWEDLESAFNKLVRSFALPSNGLISAGLTEQEIWRKAAKQDHFAALYNLGRLTDTGIGKESFASLRTRYVKSQQNTLTETSEAFYWWRRAQNASDVEAQFRIGFFYNLGWGMEQDFKKAMPWYLMAADKNHAGAQSAIGAFYCGGQGVKKDFERAMEWLLKATNQNEVLAQINLGVLHNRNDNDEEALEWYRKAANQNSLEAQIKMGQLCRRMQKYEEALEWFLKAADQNSVEACYQIGSLYDYDGGVGPNYKEAMKWRLKAAEQGHANALCEAVEHYYHSMGAPRDYEKALGCYFRLAEKNYAEGYLGIGALYEAGKGGIKKDTKEAEKWFNKAVAKDIKYANTIGDLYYRGEREIQKDPLRALKWYLRAAKQNNAEAQFKVGIFWETGEGNVRNSEEAEKWFSKAAAQDLKYVKELGELYDCGWLPKPFSKSIAKDYTKALKWYLKAAEQNDTDAQVKVGTLYEAGKGTKQNSEEAARWFTKAADQKPKRTDRIKELYHYNREIRKDSTTALNSEELADCFYEGKEGGGKDYSQTLKWYLIAAEQGVSRAQIRVGILYETGKGTIQDSNEAMRWFTQAITKYALCGLSYRVKEIASLYYEGKDGVAQNYTKALECYMKAAEQDHVDSQVKVGAFYESGTGITRNPEEANRWFTRAVTYDFKAARQIGHLYLYGREGVIKNYAKALEWYRRAAEKGDEEAKECIQEIDLMM